MAARKRQEVIVGINNLIITNHARDRFVERFYSVYPSFAGDINAKLRKLLAAAKHEQIDILKRLARIKKHGDTEYYTTKCGWRFVVAIEEDGTRLLVTAERVCRLQNKRITTCT